MNIIINPKCFSQSSIIKDYAEGKWLSSKNNVWQKKICSRRIIAYNFNNMRKNFGLAITFINIICDMTDNTMAIWCEGHTNLLCIIHFIRCVDIGVLCTPIGCAAWDQLSTSHLVSHTLQ